MRSPFPRTDLDRSQREPSSVLLEAAAALGRPEFHDRRAGRDDPECRLAPSATPSSQRAKPPPRSAARSRSAKRPGRTASREVSSAFPRAGAASHPSIFRASRQLRSPDGNGGAMDGTPRHRRPGHADPGAHPGQADLAIRAGEAPRLPAPFPAAKSPRVRRAGGAAPSQTRNRSAVLRESLPRGGQALLRAARHRFCSPHASRSPTGVLARTPSRTPRSTNSVKGVPPRRRSRPRAAARSASPGPAGVARPRMERNTAAAASIAAETRFGRPDPSSSRSATTRSSCTGGSTGSTSKAGRRSSRDFKTGKPHPRNGKEQDPDPCIDLQIARLRTRRPLARRRMEDSHERCRAPTCMSGASRRPSEASGTTSRRTWSRQACRPGWRSPPGSSRDRIFPRTLRSGRLQLLPLQAGLRRRRLRARRRAPRRRGRGPWRIPRLKWATPRRRRRGRLTMPRPARRTPGLPTRRSATRRSPSATATSSSTPAPAPARRRSS